jgi:hypothetical protein
MSPLLGHQEHNLTLSWQNFTVKVKRRQVGCGSTRAWLRYFLSCKNSEEVTILQNGELEQEALCRLSSRTILSAVLEHLFWFSAKFLL